MDGKAFQTQRYRIALLAFFGFMFIYTMRTNFSVAILCMTKTPKWNVSGFDSMVNSSDVEESYVICGNDVTMKKRSDEKGGEFEWDKQLQSRMLASFFYGYIITQVIGGWLSRRYGGRRVIGIGMTFCILSTLLMPVCARAHVSLVFVLRIIAGLASGVTFPAMHCIWGRWAPPFERSKLTSIHFAGPPIGNIVTFLLSGYLCAHGFDNGWGSIFYIFGGTACLWLVCWFYVVYDTPKLHPRISKDEREYIETEIGDSYLEDERKIKTPWAAMMKSRAMWANIVAHFCNNWTGYTLLTGLPTYMREVLNFNIKQNGALSAVPYICQVLCSLLTGFLADTLREKRVLSTVNTRRLFQCTAFLGAAGFMIATGYTTCETRMLAVVFLSLAMAFQSLCRAGYLVNHIDIGPRYAGEQFGVTNTVATMPGMIAPLVNGALTPNKTQSEWQTVFFVCGGFSLLGAVVFGFLVRGEVQPWARKQIQEDKLNKDEGKDVRVSRSVLNDGYEIIVYPPERAMFIDEKEELIGQKEEFIDEKEELNDEKEELIAQKAELIDEREELIGQKEEPIDEKEKLIDEKEELIDEKEELNDEKEKLIDEKEKLIDEKEELIDEKEELIDEKEKLIDEKEKLIDEKEELINQDNLESACEKNHTL